LIATNNNNNNNPGYLTKLTGEMKTGIMNWMQKLGKSTREFPLHNLKPGNYQGHTVLILNGWNYCDIKHAEHIDRTGKVYFLINANRTKIVQKCHSATCDGQNIHVWMSEAEIERREKSNTDTTRTFNLNQTLERKKRDIQKTLRFNARPASPHSRPTPSPDSRAMESTYMPKYTETETSANAIPDLASHHYRAFDSRMDAKSYYEDQFIANRSIYPLVISTSTGFQLESSNVLVEQKRVDQAKAEFLYIVIYDDQLKICVAWGIISKNEAKLRPAKDRTKYIIERLKVTPALTLKTALQIQLASAILPFPVAPGCKPLEYEPEIRFQKQRI